MGANAREPHEAGHGGADGADARQSASGQPGQPASGHSSESPDTAQPSPERDAAEQAAPDLIEAVRRLHATGRAGLGAAGDTTRAMHSLIAADISLARSALGRALAYTAMAVVFGGSAWLLLMATLIVFLSRPLGIPWPVSLLASAVLSIVLAAFGLWRAMRYFEHTRLQATRRQLARLGIGELSDLMPGPGSPESAREVARRHRKARSKGEALKDKMGVDLTSP